MKKSKRYYHTKFSVETIEMAYALFISKIDKKDIDEIPDVLRIKTDSETWQYDSKEEFFVNYSKECNYTFSHEPILSFDFYLTNYWKNDIEVTIKIPNRVDIEAVFNIFEKNLDKSKMIVEKDPIKVFIGHGQDPQWRDLKDHLHEKHGFDVTAYEVGPRAGLSVKEVLKEMLNESSFAFLVLTGEDMDADGEMHARENVIHEAGLFQGRLGFRRAIVLLEKGVNEFSNIYGLNQIRFSKGNIRESFGDVLATIRREVMGEDA